MNEIQIFKNEEFGSVRTIEIEGEPWFVGKDVATILGYKDTSDALKKHVDSEDKLTRRFADSGQNRTMYIINESGLYSLILSSKLESAKKFKRWVTSDVIPCIRKHGAYMSPEIIEQTLMNPDFIIQLATELKNEQEKSKVLEAKNSELMIDNQLLSQDTLTWTNRQNINAIIRKLAGTLNIGFGYCWNYIYKELLYKYNISVKSRAAADKRKKSHRTFLDYIHDDEWQKLEATIAAICTNRGINPNNFFKEALGTDLKTPVTA